MLVIILMFWVLAGLVFSATQWIVPALYGNGPSSAPNGFNYGQVLGVPFIKTWGIWIAGILFLFGPLLAGWRALERGGDAVMARALGTTKNRRGRR
jgi:uncharacterized membrane protein YecN with MAPEG domain